MTLLRFGFRSSLFCGALIALNAGAAQLPVQHGNKLVGRSILSSESSNTAAQPIVTLNTPAKGANQLSGYAYNVDPSTTKVVIYALTNEWYVQPLIDAPFTNIAPDGSWASSTSSWSTLVVLVVNPANYTPMATEITNPALDPGVLAYTMYPSGPASLSFSGYTWGIKMTGNSPNDQFDPGPNFWSNNSSVVNVAADGLHLKISQINGNWQCGEVYLTNSLGYGTYTVQVSSHLDLLDQNTVAAPLFIYAGPGQELDNEYSGSGGLVASPDSAQFVVQPYTVPGNIVRYLQPSTAKFTSQIEWAADHVKFTTWNGGWSIPPTSDIIDQWIYTGSYIPRPGQERVHINLWQLNGNAPIRGAGDEIVINSFTFQAVSAPLQFVAVTPCRVVDTRNPDGSLSGPELAGNTVRTFYIPSSGCNIPSNAAAYSLNVTAVPEGELGFLSVWPAGESQPVVSTLNSDGRVKANAAIVAAGSNGGINVYASDPTQAIIDIDGYFVAAGSATLAFYPITPCRVADTRNAKGPLGGPYLTGGSPRAFPVLASSCSIPATAGAYSVNLTAIPHGPLWFLSVWPAGEAQPWVSTLNSQSSAVTANAAIVPAGANGDVTIYATNDTDLVIDINGYFAPPGSGGLSLYTLRPCRVMDTRSSPGEFSGVLTANVPGSICGALAAAAQGFVLNATVVPASPLGFLTLWPDGVTRPEASTLNASDGAVTSNLTIVPTSNGLIDAFASSQTQLILDISGFFAP